MLDDILSDETPSRKQQVSKSVDDCSNNVTDFSKSARDIDGATLLDWNNSQRLSSSGLTAKDIEQSLCFNFQGGLAFTYLDPTGKEYGYGNNNPFYRYRVQWSDKKRAEAAENLETLPKYISPPNCGCTKPYHSPLHVKDKTYSIRLQKTKYPIILTEGEIKTLVSSIHERATGCATVTIGLGGVSAWSDKRTDVDEDGDRQLIPELLADIEWEHRDVYIAFDSDIIEKRSVQAEIQALAIALHKLDARIWLIRLPQELPGVFKDPKNGLDDFIIRHGYKAFLKLLESAVKLTVTYENMPDKSRRYFLKDFVGEPNGKSESHIKALMAWSTLKESTAVRRAVGAYQWEGTHWQEQDGKTKDSLALRLEDFYDAQRWVNRVGAVFNNANAELERRLTVGKNHWAPAHLLAFTNLVLDTQTGKTQPHSPTAMVTSCLPYPYDTAAKCPKWERFLKEALGNDDSLIQLARAAIRWILMPKEKGLPFEIDKAFNCNGPRGSGKGTFVSTVRALVGPDNVGAGGPDVYGDKEKLAKLVDKKLALDSDAKGFLPSSTNFNKVVSNEEVTIEAKYKDSDDVALGVVVLWASNEPITVAKDGAEGVGRRLISIPFNNQPKEVNIKLKAQLREELPGIFQWAWSMSESKMYEVLSGPVESDSAIELAIDQLLNSNLTLRYLSEEKPDGCDWTKAKNLYEPFAQWLKSNGHGNISSTSFGKELSRIKGAEKKMSNGVRWQLPPMRRRIGSGMEPLQNTSKEESFYDYAEHLGIGKQTDPSDTLPNASKRNGFEGNSTQPLQQAFQATTQSETAISDSKPSKWNSWKSFF